MKLIEKVLTKFLLMCLTLMVSSIGHAGDGNQECPNGFIHYQHEQICQADDTYKYLFTDIPSSHKCPLGYEHVAGLSYCIASGTIVDRDGKLLLLSENSTESCPENFSKPVGSSICVADNFVFTENPDKSDLASSYNSNQHDTVLREYVGPPCPPNFFRPPGVRHCLARNIVYNTDSYIYPPAPVGNCPVGWFRPERMHYCVPDNNVQALIIDDFDLTVQVNPPIDEEDDEVLFSLLNPCDEGTREIWLRLPKYNKSGVFKWKFIPSRACYPDRLVQPGM